MRAWTWTGGQTVDEWHVSDPLYDNYNMDHLLRFTNGSALPPRRPAENDTPGAFGLNTIRELHLVHRTFFMTAFHLWHQQYDFLWAVTTAQRTHYTHRCIRWQGPTLTNYYSITMSPEAGLTSANRLVCVSMCVCLYAVQWCQFNYIVYVHSQ